MASCQVTLTLGWLSNGPFGTPFHFRNGFLESKAAYWAFVTGTEASQKGWATSTWWRGPSWSARPDSESGLPIQPTPAGISHHRGFSSSWGVRKEEKRSSS